MIGRRGGGSTRTVGANGADGRAPRRGPARISITTDAQRRCRLERVSARSAMRTEYATTIATPVPGHVPFWSKPDSIFGLPLFTAFISTSPGLTRPGLLAPDRRDAGSRRVGSRSHGRSEDRGYVVPQASDLAVAGDARWGSRPMAEHRVMSEDLLGKRITDREDATNRTQPDRKQR